MDQNWFYLIEQASDMSKIKFSFIIYACCSNKTTKTINNLTNEQPCSHFFLTDPLLGLKKDGSCTRYHVLTIKMNGGVLGNAENEQECKYYTAVVVMAGG